MHLSFLVCKELRRNPYGEKVLPPTKQVITISRLAKDTRTNQSFVTVKAQQYQKFVALFAALNQFNCSDARQRRSKLDFKAQVLKGALRRRINRDITKGAAEVSD